MHFHPVFSLLVVPLLLVSGLFALPYINAPAESAGVWFRSGKGRTMALTAVVVATAATVGGVLLDEFVIKTSQAGPPNMMSNGLVPFAIVLTFCAAFVVLIQRAFTATRTEAIQALFTLLTTAFVVLTIIGIWFRGSGMQLMWAG